MSSNAFVPALRAELEAIIARYEALTLSHQELLAAAKDQESTALRAEILSAQRERNQLSEKCQNLNAQVAKLDDELVKEKAAHDRELLRLNEEIAELRSTLSESNAKADRVQSALHALDSSTKTFQEAFSKEKAFVDACAELIGAPLLDALQEALGEPLRPEANVYSAIKQRRMDALLLQAMTERGRTVANMPLLSSEVAALNDLARAAGCELVQAQPGQRFSGSTMVKAATRPDPAEEGNVISSLMPGLRLAGSDGTLLFPKVLVAVG